MANLVTAADLDALRGRLLERVVCTADPGQAYVLYVPSTYVPEQRWPVIFCFDAMARGRMPVERLQAAAEKYGYIVAGSLTSRNGPWTANAAAAKAMITDVSSHLSVDPRRVYTAGVSGGARVATALAMSGGIKGVIACAAGFPQTMEIPGKVSFGFFGTAGAEDFNYQELLRADADLDARKAEHRVVIFPGEHQWAPEELMAEAVEWFELYAMRAGLRPKDETFLAEQWRRRREGVPAGPPLARWRALKSLVADFNDRPEAAAFNEELRALTASAALKDAFRVERKLEERENRIVTDLGEAAAGSLATKRKVAAEVQKQAETVSDPAERAAVRRAIANYLMMTRETGRSLFEENRYSEAADFLELAVMLSPQRGSLWYDLARARGYCKDTAGALAALRSAADAGYHDAAKVEAEEAFKRLQGNKDFIAVISRMRVGPSAEVVQLPPMRVSAMLAAVELRIVYQPRRGDDLPLISFLRVETVKPTSEAAAAGVHPGLEVTAIQGKRLHGCTDDELNRLMKEAVRNEVLLVVREPQAIERELRIVVRTGSRAGRSP